MASPPGASLRRPEEVSCRAPQARLHPMLSWAATRAWDMHQAEHKAGTPAFLELPGQGPHRGTEKLHTRAGPPVPKPGIVSSAAWLPPEAGRRPHEKQVNQGSPWMGQKACPSWRA